MRTREETGDPGRGTGSDTNMVCKHKQIPGFFHCWINLLPCEVDHWSVKILLLLYFYNENESIYDLFSSSTELFLSIQSVYVGFLLSRAFLETLHLPNKNVWWFSCTVSFRKTALSNEVVGCLTEAPHTFNIAILDKQLGGGRGGTSSNNLWYFFLQQQSSSSLIPQLYSSLVPHLSYKTIIIITITITISIISSSSPSSSPSHHHHHHDHQHHVIITIMSSSPSYHHHHHHHQHHHPVNRNTE